MYTETLSPTFTGMTFAQASELCFVKLKLLLLALEASTLRLEIWDRVLVTQTQVRPDDGGDAKISINPRGAKIPANTVGFFIAQSAEEVKRWVRPSHQVKDNHIQLTLIHPFLFYKLIICVTRAWYYCKACHEDMKNETQIRKCKCKNCEYLRFFF